MFTYLVLLFTIVPAVELAILIKVGTYIGTIETLSLIVLTGVLGAALARIQGFTVLQSIQASLNRGVMPTESMLDGLMIFAGGIVLLTPGFITDALGFLLLIPWTRDLIKYAVKRYLAQSVQEGGISSTMSRSRTQRLHSDAEDADYY